MSDAGKPRKPRTVNPQPDDAGRAVLERVARTGKGAAQTGAAQTGSAQAGTPPKARSRDGKTTRQPAPAKAAASAEGKPGSAPKSVSSSGPAQGKRRQAPSRHNSGSHSGDKLGLALLVLVILAAAVARFLLPGPHAAVPGTGPLQGAGQLHLRFLDTRPGTVLLTSPEGRTLLYGLADSGPDLLGKYGVKRPDLLIAGGAVPASWTGVRPVPRGLSSLGSVKLRVLDSPNGTPGLLLSYGEFRALLTGENGPETVPGWLKAGGEAAYGPVQIYQGIRRGETAAWLAAVRPEAVVLSLGRAPTLGSLPDARTLDLYRQTGARIWRSDVSGTISFTATADGRFVAHAER
ncbi:hypothetical protein [Deinococcus sp.]|uniref:hypothetical protein n=1 Tax=Deinococcus sp. TaxID=47478 RepID=UPI0025D4E86D|nr:hypothetical protein [Deinococcus sp.]